ncbi:MAG TPA: diguanylate cyclase [Thermoanaerobaculia bacterium]|nr:diguanylate cyclase [Thermoanaerobaculia bacterium]
MSNQETPHTVAIVDDDRAIRNLVRLFLKRGGYSLVECTTGEEARSMLMDKAWDVAILDRRLPDMDGVVLAQELKRDFDLRNRYVIMLTGEDEPADKIEGLDLGADDYMTKPFHMPELMARIRAGLRIVELQKELIVANRRLERLSITDGLTQLYNHRHFQDELARYFNEAQRYDRPLSLALIDIDFFKKVNDTHGHAVGDAVLKAVARLFSESIRATDLAARYGGEEFAVIMPETELADALLFAEQIRAAIERSPVQTEDTEVRVTVSIGVSAAPHPQIPTPMRLIEDADEALYHAKENGRNQVQAERRKSHEPFPSAQLQ